MQVKTLRPHDNAHGDKYQKAVGDEYEHPSPAVLINDKIVAPVTTKTVDTKKTA